MKKIKTKKMKSKETNANLKNAVTYARHATTEQIGNGSLKNQENKLVEFASANGYKVIKRFSEIHASDDLKKLKPFIEYAKSSKVNIDYLIVQSPDRLSRNFSIYNKHVKQLQKIGVKIICVSGDGPFFHLLKRFLTLAITLIFLCYLL